MGLERLDSAKPELRTEGEVIRRREELPDEIADEYVELPREEGGGFVQRQDLERFKYWEREANELNAERSKLKKVFMVGKTTAYKLMRMNGARNLESFLKNKHQSIDYLKRAAENTFNSVSSLLNENPEFRELVVHHHIDSILSEDASGRFPALVVMKFLNTIYTKTDQQRIRMYGIPVGRSDVKTINDHFVSPVAEARLKELFNQKLLGERCLLVTDYSSSGRTLKAIREAWHMVSPHVLTAVTMGTSSRFRPWTEPTYHGIARDDGVFDKAIVRDIRRKRSYRSENFETVDKHGRGKGLHVMGEDLSAEELILRQEAINECVKMLEEKFSDELANEIKGATPMSK